MFADFQQQLVSAMKRHLGQSWRYLVALDTAEAAGPGAAMSVDLARSAQPADEDFYDVAWPADAAPSQYRQLRSR